MFFEIHLVEGWFLYQDGQGHLHRYERGADASEHPQAHLLPWHNEVGHLLLVHNPHAPNNPFADGQVPGEVIVEHLPTETPEQEAAFFATGATIANRHYYQRVD
jgi:hypothetical protein